MDRIARLKEFLAASPEDSFLQHALALEYVKLGDDTTARGIFESLLARDPGYTGSYYHLGKLLERQEQNEAAIKCYETGMEKCKAAGEQHNYNELRGALEELTF